MAKSKNYHDFISESEFTIEGEDKSTDPQEDSPGDSENDAGLEFKMGMNFQPIASELADEDEKFIRKSSVLERPNNLNYSPRDIKFRIPASAMIKSSELPAPWEDKDSSTSSN